jgi:hypothetical protein
LGPYIFINKSLQFIYKIEPDSNNNYIIHMIFKKKKIISFMKKKKMNYILQVLELFPMGQIFFIINSKFNDDPIRLSIIN